MTEQWLRGENRLTVDVVLLLFTGLVADVNRSHSTVADKTRSFVLTRYRSAVDTVHRGETGIVCGIRNLQKKSQIAFRSSNIADATENVDDEARVARPAVAVVPGALSIWRLRNRGCDRRDDRARRLVDVQLQRDGGAHYAVPPL